MIWSRTRASSGVAKTVSNKARASVSVSPLTSSVGSFFSSGFTTRVVRTKPTDSAANRRATNTSVCDEAWSSHCRSSTKQTSGSTSAMLENMFNTANPTRRRSGAGPVV